MSFSLALSAHVLFSSAVGHCPDPVLVNGEFSSSGPVNVRDKITFKCNEHYLLKGSNWSQCLENHTWVPPFPVCKSSKCQRNLHMFLKYWSADTLGARHIPAMLSSFLRGGRAEHPAGSWGAGGAPRAEPQLTDAFQWNEQHPDNERHLCLFSSRIPSY